MERRIRVAGWGIAGAASLVLVGTSLVVLATCIAQTGCSTCVRSRVEEGSRR